MSGCYLGIDIGTSAVKAVLAEPDGKISAQSRVTLLADAHGERDSRDWLDGVQAALAQLPADDLARVLSVGLTGLTPTTVPVDEAGRPAGPALTWQHSAAGAEAAELAARFGDSAELLGTSLPWGPGYPPAQLAWLARHRPEVRAATRWVLQAKDFAGMALTGSPLSDRWSSKGICNVVTGAPAADIVRAAGWDPAVSPPTAEPWSSRGAVTAAASIRFGIRAGVPVSVGWSDALGAMLALGVFERPRAFAILGTSCIAGASLGSGDASGAGSAGGAGLLYVPASVAPLALAYGPTQNGGSVLDWLAGITGRSVPELMELSEQADPAATPVFAPYLAGERAPLWEPDARGVLTGLMTATGAAELARAALRGIAGTIRNVLEHAERAAGTRYRDVTVGGGLAGQPGWLMAAGEVLGRPFGVVDEEPSGYGAAMLGASAAGGSLPHLAARSALAPAEGAPADGGEAADEGPADGGPAADEAFARFLVATEIALAGGSA